ncbi:hypothetical protein DY000_02010561 [Brassica cretica]|uniref:DUF3444 domain-containing protein n=1 Tax=Brassica cretica TaxID=69181 RepID=A0ABQ7C0J3_BRACR|nr:hypothetical protein DY000_02010561 [Brassica cretica]
MKGKRHAPHVPSYQPQHAPPPRAFYTAPVSQTNVNVARNSFTNQPKTQAPQASGFSESQTAFQVSPDQPTFSFYKHSTLMEMEMEIGRRLWNLRTAFLVRVAMNLKKLQQLVDNILEESAAALPRTIEEEAVKSNQACHHHSPPSSEPDCIIIPNFEFHDFSGKRSEGKFTVGQIWSLNCKEEGLPNYYTKIQKVFTSERGGAPMGYIELDSTAASPIKRQEQDLSMGEVEFEATKKKAEEFKTSKKKEKKKKMKRFKISIRKAYLEYLRIPNIFQDKYIKSESNVMFKIHHAEGKGSWNVLCVVKKWHATFSKGWSQLA